MFCRSLIGMRGVNGSSEETKHVASPRADRCRAHQHPGLTIDDQLDDPVVSGTRVSPRGSSTWTPGKVSGAFGLRRWLRA